MKNKFYIAALALALTLLTATCDREPMAPPDPVVDYVTIAQLREMYESGITTIDTSIYIQGIITLTPELGNVTDFIAYVQDTSGAICITVSDDENTLAMDSEVKILCNGLSFTDYNGLLQFGDISISSQVELINLSAGAPVPDTVSIDQLLTGAYESEYVYVPDVQFEKEGTFSGTQLLTDCSSEIAVHTRSTSSIASETMPTGRGSLKGVSSVYTDQQILLRDNAELDMAGDRCNGAGTTYLYQDFSGFTANYQNVSKLTGWLTYAQAGTKTWFSYNHYGYFVETTAYKSNAASVISWMTAPQVDLTNSTRPYVSFDCADGYDNGATLQLFVSVDYDGSATPWNFTWTELTFTHPPSSTSTYSSFTSSGKVDLSAYKGKKVYIAWVYKGADPSGTANDDTTTYEVDNITVAEQ